jgi:hypothetical protein
VVSALRRAARGSSIATTRATIRAAPSAAIQEQKLELSCPVMPARGENMDVAYRARAKKNRPTG